MTGLARETRAALERLAGLVGRADAGSDTAGGAAGALELLAAMRGLAAALEDDPAQLALVRAALAAGSGWDEVAEAAGLSPSAAKYHWAGDDEEIERRQEASRARKRERPSSRPTDLPGESVAEAAKRLGVTPQAIYQRVTRGLVEARTIELPDGRSYKRVFFPE